MNKIDKWALIREEAAKVDVVPGKLEYMGGDGEWQQVVGFVGAIDTRAFTSTLERVINVIQCELEASTRAVFGHIDWAGLDRLSSYERMASNLPPPRKRRHGGRWGKRVKR